MREGGGRTRTQVVSTPAARGVFSMAASRWGSTPASMLMAVLLCGLLLGAMSALTVLLGGSAFLAHALMNSFELAGRMPVLTTYSCLLLIAGIGVAIYRWRFRPDLRAAARRAPDEEPIPILGGRETRSRALLLEISLYMAVAILLFWPAVFHLHEVIVGVGDAPYFAWNGWRIAALITEGGIGELMIPDVVWPHGFDLRLHDAFLPIAISTMWNLIFGPVLAYNLTLLTGTFLNLWAGRRIGKAVSNSRAVWIASALALATAPAVTVRLRVHLTLYFIFGAALLVEYAVRHVVREEPIRPLRLAVLLSVAFLSSVFQLAFGGIAFLGIVLFGSARSQWKRISTQVAAGGALFLLMAMPFLVPRMQFVAAERAAGGQAVLVDQAISRSPWVTSVAIAPSDPESWHDLVIRPGWVLLLAAGGLMLLRTPARKPLLLTSLLIWVLMLGPAFRLGDGAFPQTPNGTPIAWLPFRLLMAVPGLGFLRDPGRATFGLVPVLTAGLALSLVWLLPRLHPRSAVGLGGIGAALLASNIMLPIPQEALVPDPRMEVALEQVRDIAAPEDRVLSVPADCAIGPDPRVRYQMVHRLPIIGCHGPPSALPLFSGLDDYAQSAGLAALRCNPRLLGWRPTTFSRTPLRQHHLDEVQEHFGARFLIVDKDSLQAPGCNDLGLGLTLFRSQAVLDEGETWIVLDLGSHTL